MRKIKVFFLNAIIMTATALLLRTVGVFFSVYVSNKIGSAGMGLYQLIMSIYRFATTLAMSGIGLTATRLVAEELARGNEIGAKSAMRRSLLYALAFGMLSFLLLAAGAKHIGTVWLRDERTIRPLYLLAVSMPCISVSVALNGYFTAVRRVVKSACSQVLEQFLKITLCIWLLSFLMPKGLEYACIAIVGGGAAAEILSCIYQYILYLLDKRKIGKSGQTEPGMTKRLLGIALPVAFSSYLRAGLTTIEQIMIPIGLERYGAQKERALSQYGMIDGMVMPVILFPSAFLSAFASLLVPEVAESRAPGDTNRIHYVMAAAIKVTLIFSIFIVAVFMAFSGEFGRIIYKSEEVGFYIKIFAPLIMAMYCDSVVDGMLKGLNEQLSSMRYNVVDSFVSVVLVYSLIPVIGIAGYVIVIYVSELLNAYLSLRRLVKVSGFHLDIKNWVIKPALGAAAAMAAVRTCIHFLGGEALSGLDLTIAIVCAALAYFILLLLLECVTRSDFKLIAGIFKKEKCA